ELCSPVESPAATRRPGRSPTDAWARVPSAASALLLLGAVATACLLAVLHTLGVERAADDLVAHTRQVLHTTATHQHHGVLLQVVALARDVGGDLDLGGQLHACDLAKRRVRLLRGGGVHAGAHAAALRAALECGDPHL